MRRKFKAEDLKRSEAVEASWAAMLAKYPPMAPESEADAEAAAQRVRADAVETILSRQNAGRSDLAGDVNWVYARLGDDEMAPPEAPSLGAWSLWHWARENRSKFFEQILPKALAVKQRSDEAETAQADSTKEAS
jgi:hypothetical protein